MNNQRTIMFFLAMACFGFVGWPGNILATTWYHYGFEGTVGNNLPSSSTNGPTFFEYYAPGNPQHDETAKYANTTPTAINGSYASLNAWNYASFGSQHDYGVELANDNGLYGTAFDESNPVYMNHGTTYYLAGLFRYNRVGGLDVFHDQYSIHGNQFQSMSKLLEFYGQTRWVIYSGWTDAFNNIEKNHKFTFSFDSTMSTCNPAVCGYEHRPHTESPYSASNPYSCDYEKWYAVVGAIEPSSSTSAHDGRVRLWINGILVQDFQNQITHTNTSMPNFVRLHVNTTVAQPAYDAPQYNLLMDELTFTDDLTFLQQHGFFQDPEGGTPPPADTTPPAVSLSAPASGSTVSGASVVVSATASDNVGVAGVQFKLDGNNLGSEDVSSPYSINWDTASVSNGSHSLTAVARDEAANQTTSSASMVTVSNAVPDTTPPLAPSGLSVD